MTLLDIVEEFVRNSDLASTAFWKRWLEAEQSSRIAALMGMMSEWDYTVLHKRVESLNAGDVELLLSSRSIPIVVEFVAGSEKNSDLAHLRSYLVAIRNLEVD